MRAGAVHGPGRALPGHKPQEAGPPRASVLRPRALPLQREGATRGLRLWLGYNAHCLCITATLAASACACVRVRSGQVYARNWLCMSVWHCALFDLLCCSWVFNRCKRHMQVRVPALPFLLKRHIELISGVFSAAYHVWLHSMISLLPASSQYVYYSSLSAIQQQAARSGRMHPDQAQQPRYSTTVALDIGSGASGALTTTNSAPTVVTSLFVHVPPFSVVPFLSQLSFLRQLVALIAESAGRQLAGQDSGVGQAAKCCARKSRGLWRQPIAAVARGFLWLIGARGGPHAMAGQGKAAACGRAVMACAAFASAVGALCL
jgi:hypothetical protein